MSFELIFHDYFNLQVINDDKIENFTIFNIMIAISFIEACHLVKVNKQKQQKILNAKEELIPKEFDLVPFIDPLPSSHKSPPYQPWFIFTFTWL